MRVKVFIFVVLMGSFFSSDAQRWKRYRWETIYGIGIANFLGELGGANQVGTDYMKDFDWKAVRPALTVGIRFKQTQQISHKANLTLALVAGNDQWTEDPIRLARNLNFRSPLVEIGYNFEFYLKKEKRGHRFKLRGVKGLRNMGLYPYGFFGVSGFFFSPQGNVGGNWKWLKPLRTEGQGIFETRAEYSRFQLAVPLGIGVKYAIDRRWLISIEYGMRKTFTDYIDDVSTTYFNKEIQEQETGSVGLLAADPSQGAWVGAQAYQQRGDPTDNDSYLFLIIGANYKLKTGRSGLPKFR
jgi:hypothetical protein